MALTTFREVANAIEDSPELKKDLKKILYTNGNEAIILKNGARLDVRAATRDSARGASADFLFIDELREIDSEAFAAALPVTRARPNSQSLFCSNAGDGFSETLIAPTAPTLTQTGFVEHSGFFSFIKIFIKDEYHS